jgi:hypothetical protein
MACRPMEDLATVEISRSHLWQWLHRSARLSSGQQVDAELVHRLIDEELTKIRGLVRDQAYEGGRFREAGEVSTSSYLPEDFVEFRTLPGAVLHPAAGRRAQRGPRSHVARLREPVRGAGRIVGQVAAGPALLGLAAARSAGRMDRGAIRPGPTRESFRAWWKRRKRAARGRSEQPGGTP